jgi:hypothetical protein
MKQFSGKWKVKKDGTMVLKWKKRKVGSLKPLDMVNEKE